MFSAVTRRLSPVLLLLVVAFTPVQAASEKSTVKPVAAPVQSSGINAARLGNALGNTCEGYGTRSKCRAAGCTWIGRCGNCQ